jgi:phosphoribosylanthranilate isomerase
MRTRVKICGITRIDDAVAAVNAGADAIGVVFDPDSPRAVSIETARAIVAVLPPFVSAVGLFVDAPVDTVRQITARLSLSLLQFHGAETHDYCAQFGRAYIKAVRMADNVDLRIEEKRYGDSVGLLLDAYVPGVAGGSGHTFDWARIPRNLVKPIVLAGGLTPENVATAIRQARPFAVDVSSGVEVSKGIKDPAKISAFVRAVREAAA